MIYVHFSGQSGGSTGLKNEHKSLTKLTFCLNKKLNFVNDFLKNIAVLQILIPEYYFEFLEKPSFFDYIRNIPIFLKIV